MSLITPGRWLELISQRLDVGLSVSAAWEPVDV